MGCQVGKSRSGGRRMGAGVMRERRTPGPHERRVDGQQRRKPHRPRHRWPLDHFAAAFFAAAFFGAGLGGATGAATTGGISPST